jgi:hypothetical protein
MDPRTEAQEDDIKKRLSKLEHEKRVLEIELAIICLRKQLADLKNPVIDLSAGDDENAEETASPLKEKPVVKQVLKDDSEMLSTSPASSFSSTLPKNNQELLQLSQERGCEVNIEPIDPSVRGQTSQNTPDQAPTGEECS